MPDPGEPHDPFEGSALTALGLAAARSVETGRPDRLIEDPLARHLFAAAELDLPMLLDWPGSTSSPTPEQALHLHGSRYIGLRTRFYDDALLEAARREISQAVAFGAGLCTRAHPLALPPAFTLSRPRGTRLRSGALAGARRRARSPAASPRC
jgi:methyltransferase (TIGR00027 family)